MGKIEHTKVEEALEKGLAKIQREKLSDLTKHLSPSEAKKMKQKKRKALTLLTLYNQLRNIWKHYRSEYKKIGLTFQEVENLIKEDVVIDKELQDKIKSAKKHITKLKKELNIDSQKLIDEEREKHINKRHNISEKWLPLK